MKKVLFFFVFLCAMAITSHAQSVCTVTGTIYKPAATTSGLLPCANCTFRVIRTIKNGVVVSTSPITVTSNASGAISFVVVDSSQIRIQGEIYGYQQGTDVNIPAAASCPVTLESLTTATPVVSTGLSLKSNNSALSANKQGTLDFSSRFALSESPSAETNIELAASGVTAGTCTNCNLTIDTYGRVTAKANGSGGSGTGLLTLNGLTADPQTFSKTDDTNVTLTITSATADHNFALGWAGQLAVARGGTGASTASGARAALGLAIGTDVQAFDSDLSSIAALTTTSFGRGLLTETNAASLKTTLSLNNVENTALSTWAGTTNLTTLGTISAGTWNGSVIGSAYGGAGTVNGLLKANGSGTVSAAVSGTDYAPATSGSAILKGNGSGGFSNAAAGTDYVAPGAATGSALTMATNRLLGRSTASSGAIEEITPAAAFSLTSGSLNIATGGVTNAMLAGSIALSKLSITGTPDGTKFLRDDGSWQAIPGGGDALTTNPLSQFAATTSAQLAGVLSDETGSGGGFVRATSPTLTTPTIAKLANLTSNGFVTTSGGDGTLGVDTATYTPTTRTISAGTGLTGGGDLSANRTLSLDINGLTEESTVASGDFVAIYDASATALRKMTRANFVSGLGGSITVREVDGTPSVSSVATVEFAQGNGFVVTDQTGGVARVDLAAVPYSALSLSGSIVNADVSGSAAIAYSKLATLTASRALVSDGSGVVSVSSVTSTELGRLSGVTSAIQTQIDGKAATSLTLTAGVGLSGGGDLSANRSFALDLAELVDNQTIFDSSQSSRTITFGLSGASDPVLTVGNGVFNVSTGTLQQGGTAVSLSGHTHAASDVTSGTLAIARGGTGTGTAPGDGKLLIGKTDGTYAVANLTAGSNITITNADGGITIASSGGASGYATIQEEGSSLTQRATLNFVGSAFTAADNSGQSRTDVTSDPDLDALASNSTNGLWARTGSGTGAARTLTAGSASITITNGDGVSGNPTIDTVQSIQTTATPRFAALGLGEAAPAAGIELTGKTINTDANNTVGAADLTFSITKNDTNTRTFSGLLIAPTLNAGGSNTNTTLNVLSVDTTNTAATGITTNLLRLAYGGAQQFVVSSAGAVSAASFNGDGSALTALNASQLTSGTVPLARLSGITNTEISGSAAIAYSKLNLSGSIVNADISGSAAIGLSKLATLTASRAIVSDGSGVLSASSVTSTELGHVSGVTSAIQTQLDAKAIATRNLTAGAGLTGGGDLSADRTFAVGAGTGIAVNADDVAIDINGLTAETTIASGDFIPIYDVSASAIRKMTRSDFVSGLAGTPGGSNTQIQYSNAGAFGGISGATSDGTNVTFGSGNLRATLPQITTGLNDANGNELFLFTATGSAVNELTIANAATGSNPTITASGGDTNVGLNFVGKGTGGFSFTSGVTTGTGASAGLRGVFNSLTTGNGADFSSSSATTGSIVRIASTSTAAASNTLTGLSIAMSGANASSAQLVSGATISVTNTNATSGTNAALTLSASGATGSTGTAPNRALNVTAGQSVFPDGSNLLPSLTFSTNKATGIYLISSTVLGFTSNASHSMVLNNFDLVMQNNGSLGITSASGTTADVILDRVAAGHWKLGSATPSATPVAQTLSPQDASGTNIAGANWTFAGSRSTGNAAGGSLIFQASPLGSSGSSQNALVTALTIPGAGGLVVPELSSAPSTPSANNVHIYALDSGGVSTLYYKKDNGTQVEIGASGYSTIQEEGSGLTQRTTFNFVGSGITASDNSGSSRTDVTLNSSLNSIASGTWTGASSITTLGTITTGTLGSGAVIGDVTMNLTGTDATGDEYSRNSSGVLIRRPAYNVRAFGAVCDGTTNDRTAIQAAIDAAGSASIVSFRGCVSTAVGSTLTIGDGTGNYTTGTATASTINDVIIEGAGVIINWTGSSGGVFSVNGPINRVRMRDIYINMGSNAGIAVDLNHPRLGEFSQIMVEANADYGFRFRAYSEWSGGDGANGNILRGLTVGSTTAGAKGYDIGHTALCSSGCTNNLDPAQNLFQNIRARFDTGVNTYVSGSIGIRLNFTDASQFDNPIIAAATALQVTPPSGTGGTNYPAGIQFNNAALTGTTSFNVTGTWTAIEKIAFFNYLTGDSQTIPSNTNTYGTTSQGQRFGFPSDTGYINGFVPQWVSSSQVRVSIGTAHIESSNRLISSTAALTSSTLTRTTTLNGALNSSQTNVVATDGSWMPSSVLIKIDSEQMSCARSGNNLTCTRGVNGTTAASHSNGATMNAAFWYHLYVYQSATAPEAVSLEVSATAPATAYFNTARSKTSDNTRRYVGSVRCDLSGNISNFTVEGLENLQEYRYLVDATSDNRVLSNVSASSNTTVDTNSVTSVYTPPIATSIYATFYNLATSGTALFDTNTSGSGGSGLNPASGTGVYAIDFSSVSSASIPLNSTQQFRYSYAFGAPSGSNFLYLDLLGFKGGR